MSLADRNLPRGPGSTVEIWADAIVRANITNAVLIALDEDTCKHFSSALRGPAVICWPTDHRLAEKLKGRIPRDFASCQKWNSALRILQLGYHVFVMDTDIVLLRNPFDDLVRDSDVEALSDGWSKDTILGKSAHDLTLKLLINRD